MNILITELSRYIIVFAMGLYVIESFWPLFLKKGDANRGVYIRQYVYIILIHTLGMASLYLAKNENRYIIFYFVQMFVIFFINRLTCILYEKISRMLLNHMCLLLSVGCTILTRLNFDKAVRQFKIICVSLIIFVFIPILIKKIKWLKKLTPIYLAVGITALLAVLSMGDTVNGSKLSFEIMGLTFQPSEFVKIVYVFFLAGLLHKENRFPRVAVSAVLAASFVLVLVASRDLGSALIFYLTYIAILFCATGKIRYSVLGLAGGAVAAITGYRLFSHVQVRIAVWLDPWTDIDNTGYQLTQSLFAIGTGGWMGMGIGKGQPETIPYVDEDFVFSAIAEEFGIVFGIELILVCLAVFLLLVKISSRIKDRFYRIVIVGLAVIYISQVVLTIGGGTRFIPLTGVTLPLVSNGGSSCMAMIILFAIAQGGSMLPLMKKEDMQAPPDLTEEYTDEITEENRNGTTEAVDAESEAAKEQDAIRDKTEEYLLQRKRRVSTWVLSGVNILVVGLMILNIVHYMIYERQEAINNTYNSKRQEILAQSTIRGSIYAQDGTILARTALNAEGMEVRDYPLGELFAHVVGYNTYGSTGLENTMNMYMLTSSISLADKVENEMAGVKNPGDSIYTSLDPQLQQIAYESIRGYNGAVIVTEAQTGRILAMVSAPDFDPNTVSQNWAELTANEDEEAVLLNRATQGLYPPGSTFKILTALEYIRQNPDSYENYFYQCNGYFKEGEDRINCYHGTVHGSLDLESSFARSCNSSFANIGMMLNREQFAQTLLELLFNTSLPVEMESSPSHISMRADMSGHEIMQTAIGQSETLITPLHLNMITQAIANDGVMLVPYAVDSVRSYDGTIVKEFSPVVYGQVMTVQETEVLTALMTAVVERGTATRLSGQSYTAAGKTGSAEYADGTSMSHAWFTGFAPADNPEIVVTVIFEKAGVGGDHAVPVARRIFEAYFD